MNRIDECATKRVFGYPTLFLLAVTGELLTYSFFSDNKINLVFLAGFNSSPKLQVYLVVVLLQELTVFFLADNIFFIASMG